MADKLLFDLNLPQICCTTLFVDLLLLADRQYYVLVVLLTGMEVEFCRTKGPLFFVELCGQLCKVRDTSLLEFGSKMLKWYWEVFVKNVEPQEYMDQMALFDQK